MGREPQVALTIPPLLLFVFERVFHFICQKTSLLDLAIRAGFAIPQGSDSFAQGLTQRSDRRLCARGRFAPQLHP